MKKRVISLMLALMLAFGMMSVSAFASGDVTLTAAPKNGGYYIGGEFTVTVAVNKGGYAGLQINTDYGENVTLVGVKVNPDLKGYSFNYDGNVIWFNCATDENGDLVVENGAVNTDYTGDVAELTFKINSDVAENTEILIFGSVLAVDAEENIVIGAVSAGGAAAGESAFASVVAEAAAFVKGDITGDGKTNNKDVTRLIQFIKGNSSGVVDGAADVSGDGKVNNKDVTALIQYIKSLS